MTVLTKDYMIQEIARCSQDIVYFLNTYGKIRHPRLGHINLTLYPFQEETLHAFNEHRFNIVLKTRQMGLSTITAGYVAWLLLFYSGKEVIVVANVRDTAQNFVEKVRLVVDNCPVWLKPKVLYNNKGSIELANKSKCKAYSTTADGPRSASGSLLIIDEAAIIENYLIEDLWRAASPTLFLGGGAIIISTPKGVGNFYHQKWEGAVEGSNDFNPISLHWTRHPVYSEGLYYDDQGKPRSPWYDKETKDKSPSDIAQEFDMDFLASGDNVFSDEYLKEHAKSICTPIKIGGFDKNLWVWEEPEPDQDYLISADVARGDSTDFSTVQVVKLANNEQVAEYKGKLPADMFASVLIALGTDYNEALIACEINSVGLATCLKLVELKYPNIYYSIPGGFNYKSNNTAKITQQYISKENMLPGFQTTSVSRPLAVSQLEEELRNKTIIIHSSRLMAEFRTFIWHLGKPQAMAKYNDDLTMAMCIGQLVKATSLKEILKAKQSTIKMIEAMSYDPNKSNGMHDYLNVQRPDKSKDPYVFIDSQGNEDNLRWLIGR